MQMHSPCGRRSRSLDNTRFDCTPVRNFPPKKRRSVAIVDALPLSRVCTAVRGTCPPPPRQANRSIVSVPTSTPGQQEGGASSPLPLHDPPRRRPEQRCRRGIDQGVQDRITRCRARRACVWGIAGGGRRLGEDSLAAGGQGGLRRDGHGAARGWSRCIGRVRWGGRRHHRPAHGGTGRRQGDGGAPAQERRRYSERGKRHTHVCLLKHFLGWRRNSRGKGESLRLSLTFFIFPFPASCRMGMVRRPGTLRGRRGTRTCHSSRLHQRWRERPRLAWTW